MINEERGGSVGWAEWPGGGEHSVVGELLVAQVAAPPYLAGEPYWAGGRRIWALLPPSYGEGVRRYPVIYMQDGQNLFDSALAHLGAEWQVDESMAMLAQEGIEAIVIGVDHAQEMRVREYSPFGKGWGNEYLAWLFGSVKPMIDEAFRTLPEREHTFMAGSSMGGLIALHALFTRREMLGGIAAMSPSLWVNRFAIVEAARRAGWVEARVYLDSGTKEGSARPMFAALAEAGAVAAGNLRFVHEKGGEHTESAWARRFPDAVRFLLGQGG